MTNDCAALAAKLDEIDGVRDNADELGELLGSPSFIVIATTVLPLVLAIAREVRGGKTLWQVVMGRLNEILEVVSILAPIVAPKTVNPPVISPVVPR